MSSWMKARIAAMVLPALLLLFVWSIVTAADIACTICWKGIGQVVTWGDL